MISLCFSERKKEDGVLNKIAGKHGAKVVGPCRSMSPASAVPGITSHDSNPFSTARGTEYLYGCAFEKDAVPMLQLEVRNFQSDARQIQLCFSWLSEWVQLLLSACMQKLTSCENCCAIHCKGIQFPADLSTLSPHRTRPMRILLEWPKLWCLKTCSSTAGERVLAWDLPCEACCTLRKPAVDLTQCGVFSTKPHLMLDMLPTCLCAINSLVRHDMGREEKRICENI